jgi:RibD C-terminal domain
MEIVDRLRLMVFPLILGSAGREPIFAGYSQQGLELVDTKVLDSRLILLEYRPAGLWLSQLAPRRLLAITGAKGRKLVASSRRPRRSRPSIPT